jgi:CRP-like cAMP-binding protein
VPTAADLKQIFLLKDLPEDALALVDRASTTLVVEGGVEIFREGEAADGLYLLRAGSVRVGKAGSDTDVVMLGTGSHFGELGLLDDAPRSATVRANERTELVKVEAARLRTLLDAEPAIAARFYRAVARSVAKRLRVTTDDLAFARQLAQERRRG